MTEQRAKYTQEEIDALGAKGHAFKNPDGSYSYPIDDEEDLKNAIHAVGRGNADHDKIRAYIIGRADDMGLKSLIPDNWNSDGSLDEEKADDDTKTCPTCDGSGTIMEGNRKCPTCGGSGEVAADYEAKALPAAAIRGELRGVPESRVASGPRFELRETTSAEGADVLRFSGFASVTGDDAAYEMEDWLGPWTESVSPNAFDQTLSNGADVAFLLNHTGMTLARSKSGTLKLSAVKDGAASPIKGVTGLHVEADLDPTNMYVQAMRSAVERGDLDEMSFAFRVTRQEWNEDYTRRWINEVSLEKGDVSLVNYAASPATGGTVSLRQKLTARVAPVSPRAALAIIGDALNELRAGKVISADTASKLAGVHTHLDAMGDAADGIKGIVDDLIAMSSGGSEQSDDDEQEDQDRTNIVDLLLPDHTTAARQKLAALRAA